MLFSNPGFFLWRQVKGLQQGSSSLQQNQDKEEPVALLRVFLCPRRICASLLQSTFHHPAMQFPQKGSLGPTGPAVTFQFGKCQHGIFLHLPMPCKMSVLMGLGRVEHCLAEPPPPPGTLWSQHSVWQQHILQNALGWGSRISKQSL